MTQHFDGTRDVVDAFDERDDVVAWRPGGRVVTEINDGKGDSVGNLAVDGLRTPDGDREFVVGLERQVRSTGAGR